MVDDVFDFVIIKKVCICYNLMRNVLFDKKNVYGLLVNYFMLFLFLV